MEGRITDCIIYNFGMGKNYWTKQPYTSPQYEYLYLIV